MPAAFQCEKQLVSKGQGFIQSGFRYSQVDKQPFRRLEVPGRIRQPACLEVCFRIGGQWVSIR
jgi:hypothetical protein